MFDQYNSPKCATGISLGEHSRVTYSQRVSAAVTHAEEALKDLKRMQEIFAQHPEFEELLTLVQRGLV